MQFGVVVVERSDKIRDCLPVSPRLPVTQDDKLPFRLLCHPKVIGQYAITYLISFSLLGCVWGVMTSTTYCVLFKFPFYSILFDSVSVLFIFLYSLAISYSILFWFFILFHSFLFYFLFHLFLINSFIFVYAIVFYFHNVFIFHVLVWEYVDSCFFANLFSIYFLQMSSTKFSRFYFLYLSENV